ncbi:glycerol dehydratase reactivase beta/small subunit family protein [Nonomuraea aridisoli]|uniref:Uncharacterized protein n=1 Tax=Nonomuraea aridisoli TaxID=2070368 RepID=A0A2W2FDK0_9ACTN|nr:glycerol dehydratase reactivase beta/small subunit family protein [Nonomuraea aridisoli]PZG23500.1 hypothetical protein C1J01_00835 [Nonomuraea aridisoli]
MPHSPARHRPAVVVLHHPGPRSRRCLGDVTAGLEEEGVPFRIEQAEETGGPDRAEQAEEGGPDRVEEAWRAREGGARELAFAAAQASELDVGVGVDAAGDVCVHHAKLPPHAPVAAGPARGARVMGHNAGRLVAGIPFKGMPPEPVSKGAAS